MDKSGAELIAAERQRQIEQEGWSAEHDDQHKRGQLATAAACYAALEQIYTQRDGPRGMIIFEDPWPFGSINAGREAMDESTFIRGHKKQYPDRIRELIVAGALIAAEIDRLQRAQDR